MHLYHILSSPYYDYHNVIAICQYADVTSESLLQVRHIGPLNSMKNETLFKF